VTIAITGGTGFVGQALIDHALDTGQEIRVLVRKQQRPRKGIEWVLGELGNKASLARLAMGASSIIHVAGVVNAPTAAGFHAGNVTGTLNLVEEAVAAGVPRLVFVSSLAAREPGLSEYGASKLRAERIVKSSGLDWTIVRPPAVYGPRDREMLELFKLSKWGVLPAAKGARASLIHVADLARLLLALVPGSEEVTHKSFEPDDGKKGGWSQRELALAIGWAMGRRPFVVGLSPAAMMGAARLDTALRRHKAKLTPDRASYMSHPDWVVSHGARPPVDLWMPQVRTREGLRKTAEWYREQKWL